MKYSIAADAASLQLLPVPGEFLISHITFVCFVVVFAAFAAFALVLLYRKTGTSGTSASSPSRVPDSTVAPTGRPSSMNRWTIAGVVVAALALVIAAVQLAHSW
ncbi:hypothetical protein [Streptomyces tirandamycinicus]|nr:hypothetical protein [Streptomyces tirandamycinicus]